jgi:hypothetical protein
MPLRTFSRPWVAAGSLLLIAAALAGVVAIILSGSSRPNRQLRIGVDLVTGFYDPSAVTQFSSLVGHKVSIVQNFVSWSYTTDPTASTFPTGRVEQILAEGAEPEISWDPSIAGAPVNQPQMSLADITAGHFDSYIRTFARAAAAVKRPILIRFAHEMNGPWTSYYVGNSGNHPGDFVKAWRHVHDIFASVGAHNVQWVWSPNIILPEGSSLEALYPGNRYVDWVGVDGYSYPKAGCETAAATFDPTFAEIARFSDRPEMLAEVGISAACPTKPALIRGLFSWLTTHPRVEAITWWERDDQGVNWNVNSNAASLKAFRAGVGSG